MIVKFKPKEDFYKDNKKLSKNSTFYLDTERRCIRSTTEKDLYLLYQLEKNTFLWASIDTINEMLIERPLIKGIDKDEKIIARLYAKAYKKIVYSLQLEKSEKKQEYDSCFKGKELKDLC